METKPVVKITLTVADLKHLPGMAVQTEVKGGGQGKPLPGNYTPKLVNKNSSDDDDI